jgi:peroxiredoxin
VSTHAVVPVRPLALGDEAPNFDLSSTAGAVLMLCDEVPRTAVLLYGFRTETARVRADLAALAGRREALARLRAKVLAFSSLPMAALEVLQAQLDLPFPLLRDDRGFADVYGLAAEEPALFVIDRRQRLMWLANPLTSLAPALPEIEALLAKLPTATAQYPKGIVNRLVDRRVN